MTESQAGFRKGYSTTDHIFTLYAMTSAFCDCKRTAKMIKTAITVYHM